jgi:hypothetical protein
MAPDQAFHARACTNLDGRADLTWVDGNPVPAQVTEGATGIRALRQAINAGKIPSTYVSSGCVVAVEKVSGTPGAAAGDEDSPLPVTASEVRAPELAALLAEHTNTYRIRTRKTPTAARRLTRKRSPRRSRS